jgi:hypothetical protein
VAIAKGVVGRKCYRTPESEFEAALGPLWARLATKSILETRPIYHKCNETIRGHVFCSFLALLLKTELERRMKFAE